MTRPIYVVGAGGFGRETLDVLMELALTGRTQREIQVVDDSPRDTDLERLRNRGVRHIGSVDAWRRTLTRNDEYIIAIGSPSTREAVAVRLAGHGRPADPVIHPTATLGTMVRLEAGTVVCAGVRISTNVHAGQHVHLNAGAIIGHDTQLEEFTSVNPGAVVSGSAQIGAATLIGANATILQHLTIGRAATVGAGAVATRNVPAETTVVGIPARRMERN